MQVIVYSTTNCPYCEMLKDYLKTKNIIFEEKKVDQDKQAQEQMIEYSGGFLGVPFTVILKGDGNKETIIGFDKDKINDMLGIRE